MEIPHFELIGAAIPPASVSLGFCCVWCQIMHAACLPLRSPPRPPLTEYKFVVRCGWHNDAHIIWSGGPNSLLATNKSSALTVHDVWVPQDEWICSVSAAMHVWSQPANGRAAGHRRKGGWGLRHGSAPPLQDDDPPALAARQATEVYTHYNPQPRRGR